jgi:hypothetical protein
MNDIDGLLEELNEYKEILSDFNKICHLFSDDDAKATLAKLYENLGQLTWKLRATKIREIKFPEEGNFKTTRDTGKLVRVRPCNEKYNHKTYLGIHLGNAALGKTMHIEDDQETIQLQFTHQNPAMYVPEINEVIYGCGSWWSEIDSVEDLKDITDETIDNTWYVKLLKEKAKAEEK